MAKWGGPQQTLGGSDDPPTPLSAHYCVFYPSLLVAIADFQFPVCLTNTYNLYG